MRWDSCQKFAWNQFSDFHGQFLQKILDSSFSSSARVTSPFLITTISQLVKFNHLVVSASGSPHDRSPVLYSHIPSKPHLAEISSTSGRRSYSDPESHKWIRPWACYRSQQSAPVPHNCSKSYHNTWDQSLAFGDSADPKSPAAVVPFACFADSSLLLGPLLLVGL